MSEYSRRLLGTVIMLVMGCLLYSKNPPTAIFILACAANCLWGRKG